jgi:hypothetical protein
MLIIGPECLSTSIMEWRMQLTFFGTVMLSELVSAYGLLLQGKYANCVHDCHYRIGAHLSCLMIFIKILAPD